MSNFTPLVRLWAWPVALALLTASGLVGALVSDGWGAVWSWLGLGVPLAVIARFGLLQPSSSKSSLSNP